VRLRSTPSIIHSGERLGSIQVSSRILGASYWVLGVVVGSPHRGPPSAAVVVLTGASSDDQTLAPTLPSGVIWSPASNTHNRAPNFGLNHQILWSPGRGFGGVMSSLDQSTQLTWSCHRGSWPGQGPTGQCLGLG
jgi:hypothetical protein